MRATKSRPSTRSTHESDAGAHRVSLRIHNGTDPGPTLPPPEPSPVALNYLCDTNEIIEMTRIWRDNCHPEPDWDDPRVWAYLVDTKMLWLNGPVRPIIGSPGAVVVGDMNGDVQGLLDFDPAPGGTPGQVVRVDVGGCLDLRRT